MKALIRLNTFITYVLVLFKSPIGQVSVIMLCIAFDAFTNGLAIANLVEDRLEIFYDTDNALVATGAEHKGDAIMFAVVASVAIGFGIFIFSLLTEVEEDEDGEVIGVKSHNAGIILAVLSFVMSATGFLLVLLPEGVNVVWDTRMYVRVFFSLLIAAFSPYTVWHLSLNLAVKYFKIFDFFIGNMLEKTHDKLNEQLEGMLNKDKRPPLTVSARNTVTQPYKFGTI